MSQIVHLTLKSAGPAPGFEQPYEMLNACHERVLRTLDLVARHPRSRELLGDIALAAMSRHEPRDDAAARAGMTKI